MDVGYGNFLRTLRGYIGNISNEQLSEVGKLIEEELCNRRNGSIERFNHVKIEKDFFRNKEGRFYLFGTVTQGINGWEIDKLEEIGPES